SCDNVELKSNVFCMGIPTFGPYLGLIVIVSEWQASEKGFGARPLWVRAQWWFMMREESPSYFIVCMVEPIISVSGLRGIVGGSLTAEVAARYAAAFASTLPPGPIVLTYDGRASGPIFLEALADVLNRIGRETIDAGVAATPTTGVLVRQWRPAAAGGIQISA